MKTDTATSIDEYINAFSPKVQKILNEVRATISKAAPLAEETIKYAMPTFVFHGNLVHFAAFKNHIGFYPAPVGVDSFAKDLSRYKTGKGSIQFPIDQPMPLSLIERMVKFRIAKNIARAKGKAAKKRSS